MWSIVHYAVQGLGHACSKIPCQDVTYYLIKNDIHVAILADGAGSAEYSYDGAKFIAEKLSEYFIIKFDDYFSEVDGISVKKDIVRFIKENLLIFSKSLDCSIRELASTLLLIAIHNNDCIIVHIGDGVIGVSKNMELSVISHPNNGEYVNTTVFTTSDNVLHDMKLIKGKSDDVDGFVMMSDGAEACLYSKKNKTLAPYIGKLFALSWIVPATCLQKILEDNLKNVIRKKTSDDCSLMIFSKINDNCLSYSSLSSYQKALLFKIRPDDPSTPKRLNFFDQILVLLITPMQINAISSNIGGKAKHIVKKLDYLKKAGFVIKENGFYRTNINLLKKCDLFSSLNSIY